MILLFLYLFFIVLVFLQIRLEYKAEKKYRFPFLIYYRTYLIFFFAYGFIKYIGHIFVIEFFSDRTDETIMITQLALLIFPFFALTLYSMLLWIRNLAEATTSVLHKIIYWGLQGFLFAFMVFNKIINPGDQFATSERLWSTIHTAEAIILFVIIIQLLFLAKKVKNKKKRQFIKSIGLIYLISFAIFEAYQQTGDLYFKEDSISYVILAGGLYFCVNLPALFYFLHFMSHYHQEMVEHPLSGDEMNEFCNAYCVTPREKEIVESIIMGKSNKEIGKGLFISIQTVKNINYNLYKKIGIKNRMQLINRIHEFKKKAEKG
jgi:DNA-binding CsgD family transcriptional regulator